MSNTELLICLFCWPLLHGGIILAVTSTINSFMHYGHILGSLRYNHARYIISTSENKDLSVLWDRAMSESIDWPDRMNRLAELYWIIAANDRKMRALICPMCIGAKLSVLICLLEGAVYFTTFDMILTTQTVAVLCCTFLFSFCWSVFVVSKLL